MRINMPIRFIICTALIGVIQQPVMADINLIERDDLSVYLKGEIGAGGFLTDDTNYGIGRVDVFAGENTGDASWFEGYFEPGIFFEYKAGSLGEFYGGLSAIFAITAFEGDAGGLTSGNEIDFDLEYAYAGWKKGVFDLSVGGQEFMIGDGFIVIDGHFDAGADGLFWFTSRYAFDNTAILKIDTKPVRADLFWIKGDEKNQGNTELAGINLEYVNEEYGTLGFTYMNAVDVKDEFNQGVPRKGMDVFSFRGTEVKIPVVPNLSFWGEYVKQTGDGEGTDFDASAWYVEAQYSFDSIPWTPKLSYRYADFSGDANDDNTRESFDPLFYGPNVDRGWGSWFQGEIAGNYQLFNSNQRNHMAKLDIYPGDTYGFGAVYLRFYLNENNYFGTPVKDKHFSDEFNIYAEWYPNDSFYAVALAGISLPGDAAKEVFGDDENYGLFQALFVYSF